MGALSHDRVGDGGYHHRVASDHLGRVFDDAASHSARVSSAHGHQPYIGADNGADLCTGGELDSACDRNGSGNRIRLVIAARLCLRRIGDGHDAGHDVPGFLRHSLRLGLSVVAVRARYRLFHADRRYFLCRRLAQSPRRRVVSAGVGRGDFHDHDDVEARAGNSARPAAGIIAAARGAPAVDLFGAPAPRPGHGGVPHVDTRCHAASVPAQPQAL